MARAAKKKTAAEPATVLDQASGDAWTMINGDCIHAMSEMPPASIDYSIYSPPFGDLFVYSDSVADMGNVSGDAEFFASYDFVIAETFRLLKPGRLVSVHCTDLPTRKGRDGYIGISPFSDRILDAHLKAGFIMQCRTTIWRDPVVEMQRTKALGLLHKQLKKDSSMSRTGLPDYLITFRKPGENAAPVRHDDIDVPVDLWQKWASPVWMDINQSKTLNVRAARQAGDERHLCPLQLDLIEISVRMWSNPGDIVLSPFAGVGSEGYEAVRRGRKFIGVELKPSYWKQACKNLADAEQQHRSGTLFDGLGAMHDRREDKMDIGA